MMGLTSRQQECFRLIEAGIQANGIAPSYEELAAGLGVVSKSRVWEIVCALEARGYIRRLPNKARALEVVDVTAPRTIALTPEVFEGVSDYASVTGAASIEVAANELLRKLVGLDA